MEKLSMSGYGLYVWSAFLLTFVVLAFNEWRARKLFRRTYRDVEVRIKALEDHE